MELHELELKSWDLRRDIVEIIMAGGGGHIGGDMSVLNTLLVLYKNHLNITPYTTADPNRDRFVLSKGHAVEALYAVLADCGFLDLVDIKERFSKFGSPYIGHPNNKLPGIEMNSGSLGHGLPVCVGMASNYQLDNLCAVVDRNRLQISGSTEEVMKQDSQEQRWAAFGWNVISVDGDSIEALDAAFTAAKHHPGQPTVILANTTKGYGSPLMENKASWHHHLPNQEEYRQIIADFAARKEALLNG